MPAPQTTEMVRRLLRRGGSSHAARILHKIHPADVAGMFRSFSYRERTRLFNLVEDKEQQSEILAHLDSDLAVELIDAIGIQKTVDLLQLVSSDDVADILDNLPDELSAQLLELLHKDASDEVAGLMRYDSATAGGIMSPDYLALRDDMTCGGAIRQIQENPDVEMAFYVYVVNEHGHLVGVASLRQLVTSRADTRIGDVMETDVVSVTTDVDQEEVARIVGRYDLLAVPVVDEANKLLGIVTVDDVIDVMREEASEDMLKLAGAGDHIVETMAVGASVRRRLPWLAAAWAGGVGASFVIDGYSGTLGRLLPLAAFIPVVLGMGGNVGTQSLTIMVRGIATGRIEFRQAWRVIGREISVGLVLGLAYGAALGVTGWLMNRDRTESVAIAGVVGLSTLGTMTMAALVGSAVPLLLHRLGIDPAVATGPFVTTAMDILGVLLYFNIAMALL